MGEVRPRRSVYAARVAPRRRGVNAHLRAESSHGVYRAPAAPSARIAATSTAAGAPGVAVRGDGLDVDQLARVVVDVVERRSDSLLPL